MKKVLNVLKKVFVVIISIIGALEIAFMALMLYYAYDASRLRLDEWIIGEIDFDFDDEERNAIYDKNKTDGGYVIETFNFKYLASYYDQMLCYNVIQEPCRYYSWQVRDKYEYKANLHIEVEKTKKTFIVKFTGWGYPDGGDPECLDRTYIYDIDGVGPDKLPILLNKNEIYY